ncbi:MAG: hypothetical protein Q4G30_08930 [Actinomycetaceae bacterium]|nr:hypothetical protein [Actinomycetaceae bacterium]
MKRSKIIKRLRREAKVRGFDMRVVEKTRHTAVTIGEVTSHLGRHKEIDDVVARLFFDQFAEVFGKGWWR